MVKKEREPATNSPRGRKLEVSLYGVRGSVSSPLSSMDLQEKFLKLLGKVTPEDLTDSSSRQSFLDRQPLSLKGTYGGHTTCVVLCEGKDWLVIDMGTGLSRFGHECVLAKRAFTQEHPLHILLTHVHWDHIQGFPFFVPAYVPGNCLKFHSARPGFKDQLLRQQESPWCPAHFEFMKADISFEEFGMSEVLSLNPWKVTALKLHHPDDNVGYRVETDKGSFVFLSDTEITGLRPSELKAYQDFCYGADCVYVDCQYDFIGAYEKIHWGHSTIFSWLDIFKGLKIKEMLCGHYDPTTVDSDIDEFAHKAKQYAQKVHGGKGFPKIKMAYEGYKISLT